MPCSDDGCSLFKSGVPGELRGFEYLHKKYGSLPWERVVSPAIDEARNGFRVTEDLVRYMEAATSIGGDFLSQDPTWAIDFAPNGTRVKLGDRMTRKRYADTLETISQKGVDAFYTGYIANATISALQAANGTMTLEDLAGYKVTIRETSQIQYRGYTITSVSAPGSGAVALSVLNTLKGYDMSGAKDLGLTTHRLDEAIRFAYGQVIIALHSKTRALSDQSACLSRGSVICGGSRPISTTDAQRRSRR